MDHLMYTKGNATPTVFHEDFQKAYLSYGTNISNVGFGC